MNTLIEAVNAAGESVLGVVWPILWQSSLLIALLFAVDIGLRKKIRASIRYALWLVVLVKLVIPPTLASPTSLAWWLRPAASTPPPSVPARSTVTPMVVADNPPALTVQPPAYSPVTLSPAP
jgi:beta-lactamase regulating signal transducer with metallopeptidase domain